MKRIMALIICMAFILSCSGCSEVEIEHFDKSTYGSMEGLSEFDETVSITINPEIMANAVMAIQDKMSLLYEDENDEDAYAPESEGYVSPEDDNAEEFMNEFLLAIRAALDENKMFSYRVSAKGGLDADNNIADENLSISFSNITLDCGSCYMRGEKMYIDKKLFYTLGSISYMNDFETLGKYYNALDDMFGDTKYVVFDYSQAYGGIDNSNFALSIADSTNILQKAQLEYYEQAKELLKDFDTGCVTRIENGTRFQIKPYEFSEIGNRFVSYIRQHNEPASKLVNDYMSLIMATSASMYGDEMNGMSYIFDDMRVTGDDIIFAMDGLKEILNSPEFDIIFRTLNITYTNDITKKDNTSCNTTVIKGEYDNKTAFEMAVDVDLTETENYEFYNIGDVNTIDYKEVSEKLAEIQEDLMYEMYNFSLYDSYQCPNCEESFEYVDTHYCENCGFVHDFYLEDENCNKQPGCELANEVQQVIA